MLALLRIPENTGTPEESFLEQYGLPERTKKELRQARRLGLVEFKDGCLQVSQEKRLKLILRCLRDGLDLERVCKTAGWREFEDLAMIILGGDGYSTKKHLRFRFDEKGYEIDVLALKSPWSLAVECKRWKKSWQPSVLRRVAESHKRKAQALAETFPEVKVRFDHSLDGEMKLVPIILMLSDTPMKIEAGLPFVPMRKLQNFLAEYAGYIEDLTVFDVNR